LDKAEELLLNGLKKDSHSADIRLKLLEVYSHLQDSSSFDKHYAALAGVAGAATLARAAELRAAIPGMGEVNLSHAKTAPAQADASDSGLGDFSFDDLQLDDEPVTESTSADISLDLADDDLSFDLDTNDDLALDDAADTSLQSSTDSGWELPGADDDNLDFEVDLDADSAEPEIVEQDDLSELSLALDDMDTGSIEDDLEVGESSIEEEFNFDFTPAPVAPAPKAKSSVSHDDDLDVAADDFNLDMDVSDVDLAALDHEMEALDDMGDLDDTLDVPSSGLSLTSDLDTGGSKFEADADEDFVLKDDDAAAEDHEDDVFAEALSDFNKGGANLDLSKFDADNFEVSDEDMDAELDFLADADEAATKLDLARAYIDMGDTEGAKDILAEVVSEGNDEQRNEAKQLLKRIDS
jgi:pilus assembly protein FimV